MSRTKYFWVRQDFCLMVALSVLLLLFGRAGLAAENESVQHYKMLSVVEYTGKSQFRNQVEGLFTVKKQSLSDDKVRYFISTNDFDPVRGPKGHLSNGVDLVGGDLNPGQQLSSREFSFVIDRKTRHLSGSGRDLELLEKVNNQCVKLLKKVTKNNIGKTWKQSFNMPFLDHLLPGELKLTLTAIQLKTKVFGDMIAVRALSEPFFVKIAKKQGGVGNVKSKINAVYLFDSEIEEIYLSISVFEATTNINGSKEQLRHETATYRTDANGVSADLSGLGGKFEKFVRKVGLARKSLKVVKESPLPQWARSEGLGAAQVANVCAGTACEGASNPVATIFIPAAQTVGMQSLGTLASVGTVRTVSTALATSVTGAAGMKIAIAPAFMGMGLGTAGAVAGGTAGTIAVAGGGGGGGGGARSPSTP